MAVVGEEVLQASSDSFWEVDGYRRTVKRVEDGSLQCSELMKMIQERADIERDYAKRLKAWAKKWNDSFDRGEVTSLKTCDVMRWLKLKLKPNKALDENSFLSYGAKRLLPAIWDHTVLPASRHK